MSIKTVIIEDETKSLQVLQQLIIHFANDLEICGTAGHLEEAVSEIESKNPDLVLMDVRLANGTSFDILRKLSSRNFELIFVTAYESYALEAIRVSAIDYILKPIGIQEFQDAINKARKRLAEKQQSNKINTFLNHLDQKSGHHKKLSIPTLNGYEFLDIQEIIWCKSEGHYTAFFLTDKSKLISSRNLGFYEELLRPYNFCRINHGIIINMRFIKSYMKGKGGSVLLTDGTELEISQRKKGEFLNRLDL